MAPQDFPAGGYWQDYVGFWVIWLLVVGGAVLFFRWNKGRRSPLRLVAGNTLVFASIAWTGILGWETYLRYWYDKTDSYALMLTNYSWFCRHVYYNKEGFRDESFSRQKPPGQARIACIGDSFTMGWGVEDPHDTWVGVVEAGLEKRNPGRYDVRNYGVAGWCTKQEAELVDGHVPSNEWDHVILGYCLNDNDDLLPSDRWFVRDRAPRMTWINPTRSFVLDRLWYDFVLSKDPQVRGYFEWAKEAYDDPKIWGLQVDRFRRIAERCRDYNVRLDVVIFPFFGQWKAGEPYEFDSCHERLIAAWRSLGVDAVDLREAYKGIPGSELMCNPKDHHPNARANAIAGKTVLDRVFGIR